MNGTLQPVLSKRSIRGAVASSGSVFRSHDLGRAIAFDSALLDTPLTGKPFFYFAYGAAVSEVIVDTLTGEHRLLAVDVLHDVGTSLNPAIDLGQVEGAFVQGYGWLTMVVWHPKTGALLTHAPSTYKIPTANDTPTHFKVALYEAPNPADTIHRSKAVGEPPLLLPFSALLAIRDAVSAVGGHRIDPPLRAPATPEAVLEAVECVQGQQRATRPNC